MNWIYFVILFSVNPGQTSWGPGSDSSKAIRAGYEFIPFDTVQIEKRDYEKWVKRYPYLVVKLDSIPK
jgi:hypothetical protein